MKHEESAVFGLVLVVLLVVEVTLGVLEPQLSGDVRHIQGIQRIGQRLEADTSAMKVLWLGNSITANGIDLQVADSVLERSLMAGPVSTYAVHPDGSGISEWLYIATSDFFDQGAAPHVLVVPFAWNLLSDQVPVDLARIGRWYLHSASDWLEFFGRDAKGFEPRAHALLANASAAFGNRDRVRNRVLALLPGYEQMAQHLSRGGEGAARESTAGEGVGYSRLRRLITVATETDTRVVLVAMPVAEPYGIDAVLQQIVDDYAGVELIDARNTEGITDASFRDAMHLRPAGARLVTTRVVEELAELVVEGTR